MIRQIQLVQNIVDWTFDFASPQDNQYLPENSVQSILSLIKSPKMSMKNRNTFQKQYQMKKPYMILTLYTHTERIQKQNVSIETPFQFVIFRDICNFKHKLTVLQLSMNFYLKVGQLLSPLLLAANHMLIHY